MGFSYVTLPCSKDEVTTKDLAILGIEENLYGEDTITYICPNCDKEHKSIVYVKR